MNGTYDSGQNWDVPGLVWLDVPPVFEPLQPRRRMIERALKLHEKSLDDKINLCIDLEQGLSNTSHVPTPKFTPAQLAAKRTAIDTQRGNVAQAESQLQMEQNSLAALVTDLEVTLEESAEHSESVVLSDRVKLAELKIPLRKIGAPSTEVPPVPTNVRGSYGDLNGEVDWMWDAVGRNLLYFGEIAQSAAGPWTQVYAGKKSRFTSKNLVSGQEYFFRVACERNDLRSNPSELANHRAT